MTTLHAQSNISFEPIVVEEIQEESSQQKEVEITPYLGAGSKEKKEIKNKFGIELSNMEEEVDISIERRVDLPQLTDRFNQKKKATLAAITIGPKRKMRLMHKSSLLLNMGGTIDSQNYQFRDNNNTPHTLSDDFDNSYQLNAKSFFLSLETGPALVEYDQLEENSVAATLITGRSYKKRIEGNLNYKGATLFYSRQNHRFDSRDPNLFDSETDIQKVVLKNRFKPLFSITPKVEISYEEWKRALLTHASFKRSSAMGELSHNWSSNRWIESKTVLSSSMIIDQNKEQPLINFKQELTSSTQYPLGIAGSFHRFERAPKPSQLFGDGAMLVANNDLPTETGWRAQAGPWLKNKSSELKLQFFMEESENTPIQEGISPSKAKTYPIGGVWTRGLFLDGKTRWSNFNFSLRYEYQNALNNGKVPWKRGNPIPGRPKHKIVSVVEWQKKKWRVGSTLTMEAELYRDLAGQDRAPDQYYSSSHISYHSKHYIMSLSFNNLFLSDEMREVGSFQDSAGANIIQPNLKVPEVRFNVEFLL